MGLGAEELALAVSCFREAVGIEDNMSPGSRE